MKKSLTFKRICDIHSNSMDNSLPELSFARKMVKEIPEVIRVVQQAHDVLETKIAFSPVVTAREACIKALHDLDTAYNWYSKIAEKGVIKND